MFLSSFKLRKEPLHYPNSRKGNFGLRVKNMGYDLGGSGWKAWFSTYLDIVAIVPGKWAY